MVSSGAAHARFQSVDALDDRLEAGRGRQHDSRVEQRQGVGDRADVEIDGRAVMAGQSRDRGGEMSAGGTAARGEAVGVNTEPFRVVAHVAHRGLGVLHAFVRRHMVAAGDAIVGEHGDHAARSEVPGLL
ncbi:MAG: hypothetical protein R2748_31330 [Bryobacterales bacterium]